MDRLAACLYGASGFAMGLAVVLFSNHKTLLSFLEPGDIPLYGLLCAGLFWGAMGYKLVHQKRRAKSGKEEEAKSIAEPVSIAGSSDSASTPSDPSVGIYAQIEPVQRTRIHFEIITLLQLEFGTERFRTRDAIKVVRDRLEADESTIRFAINWGRVQGKIVKSGHGIYQCLESVPAVNSGV